MSKFISGSLPSDLTRDSAYVVIDNPSFNYPIQAQMNTSSWMLESCLYAVRILQGSEMKASVAFGSSWMPLADFAKLYRSDFVSSGSVVVADPRVATLQKQVDKLKASLRSIAVTASGSLSS